MIVFHVCSYKKLQKYLKTGAITPPVRAWENIEQAERNIHDFISKAQVDDYTMVGCLITTKVIDIIAEKNKRIAELERRLKIACHVKADDKVKFDWAVLDKIDELEENLKAAEAVINYYKNLMEASHE